MNMSFHVKYLLFLSDFNETVIFLTVLQNNSPISNFMKLHPVVTELFHVKWHTHRNDEANSHFVKFYEHT
jgi:hypothetical protein